VTAIEFVACAERLPLTALAVTEPSEALVVMKLKYPELSVVVLADAAPLKVTVNPDGSVAFTCPLRETVWLGMTIGVSNTTEQVGSVGHSLDSNVST
jgi:hypothetical protein